MTNLEYYKDEINELIEEYGLGQVQKKIRYAFEVFSEKHIDNYPSRADKFVDWLLQEHKEPIKLKQWEKDLISQYSEGYSIDYRFSSFLSLIGLKEKGYFKGITDTSMEIEDILKKCEVIE